MPDLKQSELTNEISKERILMLKISRGGNLLRWGIQFLILIVATLVVYIVMDQGFPPAKPLLQPVASKLIKIENSNCIM